MKNVTVISHQSPFNNTHIRDALDMTLIFAAIDQNISWLFQGPAVCALKAEQSPQKSGLKNFLKTIKTLEIYDVDNIYVCKNSLDDYDLLTDQLMLDVKILNPDEQQQLLSKQDLVVTL